MPTFIHIYRQYININVNNNVNINTNIDIDNNTDINIDINTNINIDILACSTSEVVGTIGFLRQRPQCQWRQGGLHFAHYSLVESKMWLKDVEGRNRRRARFRSEGMHGACPGPVW